MSDPPIPELPQECWELIVCNLQNYHHLEPLSLVSTHFLSLSNNLRRSLTISSFSFPSLPLLLRRFPNIKQINLSPFKNEDLDSILSQISRSGLSLESLDISGQERFPFLGIKELGFVNEGLRKLCCSRVSGLKNSDLYIIGSSFPLLEELDISFPEYNSRFDSTGSLDLECLCGFVTDDGIVDLSFKLEKLRKIDLSGNHFISDKSIISLSVNCLSLNEIVVCDCDFVTQSGIGYAVRECDNLSVLRIDGIGIPCIDSFFQESFAYSKSLSELYLSNSFISDDLLCLVVEAGLPLTKLSISHCYNFTSAGIYSLLKEYRLLVHLDLTGANFLTDECMIKILEFLGNLRFINLSLCSRLTSSTFFAVASGCPLLEVIEMERTNLGVEACTEDVAVNHRIKSLRLGGNNSLSDECVKKVALCYPNIEVLDISYCLTVTEEGVIDVLRHCCEIRHLVINQCSGIKNFNIDSDLPKLEILHAQGPVVDDEALAIIGKRCNNIRNLDISGCLNVTAKGVTEIVKNCRKLREINLKWCDNMTAEIVLLMIFTRPSLRKIIPPCGFTPSSSQINFFRQHGCLVCEG